MLKNLKNLSSIATIYETYDYEIFDKVNGNRVINPLNYTKLLKSIEEKQLLIPICVNDKLQIIDGQHRFEACKTLNKPIQFYISDDYTIEDVMRANQVSKNWIRVDFLNLFISRNNENYIEFARILDIYKINITDLLKVFAYVQDISLKDLSRDFDKGYFFSEGKELVENFFIALEDFKLFNKYRTTQFVGAFMKLYFHNSYSHEKMKDRLIKRGSYVKQKGSIAEYLQMLTKDIYSFGAVKNPIYYDAQTKKFY
ncbi:ParB N-terminal domain-containing protein [Clostridium ihumii]|uniref:ParB N-terminal domain-containing protein n=1 Tax=Clostridium ihumii TaxID=1470356 RepID=UPI003D3421B7